MGLVRGLSWKDGTLDTILRGSSWQDKNSRVEFTEEHESAGKKRKLRVCQTPTKNERTNRLWFELTGGARLLLDGSTVRCALGAAHASLLFGYVLRRNSPLRAASLITPLVLRTFNEAMV